LRLLLDTHSFIWEIEGDEKLPVPVREVVEDRRNVVYLSVVSVWEMALKERAGRLRLSRPADTLIPDALEAFGFPVVPIELRHAFRAVSLPPLHADPFDRMLVAQAIEERLTLVTGDQALHGYPVQHLW
jgi:PIN domain nuclease of toxin-antitoxin system